jgi:hypothetical protein
VDFEVKSDSTGFGQVLALLDERETQRSPRPHYVFGWFKGANSGPGWSCTGCNGYGSANPSEYRGNIAHELGHGIAGVNHDGPTTGEVGFDVKNVIKAGFIKNDELRTIMGGVNSDSICWTGPTAYLEMYNGTNADGSGAGGTVETTRIPVHREGSPATWDIGTVSDINTATSSPSSLQSGAATVKLLNSSGTTLWQSAFNIPVLSESQNGEQRKDFFIEVPKYSALNKIEIYEGGSLKTSKTRSANAPSVTITSPSSGATLTSSTNIQWTATDADSDPLTAWVEYARAAGYQEPVANRLTGTSQVTFDPTGLPGTSGGTIRVRVSDGMNTTVAEVGNLSLNQNLSPTVYILTPIDGEHYRSGAGLNLSAYALDDEDGPLTGSSVSWSSDVDGPLGTGPTLDGVELSVGSHTITVTGTDSGSSQTSDSVTITIDS